MAKKKETILEKAEHLVENAEKVVGKVAKEVAKDVEMVAEKAIEEGKEIVEKVEEEVKELISGRGKKAEKSESNEEKTDKKSKLEELKKKAAKLAEKVEEAKELDVKSVKKKKETEAGEEKENTLVPMEDYLKSSIHLGTRVITPDMRQFVYRRRADGLAVFNTALLDDMIREGADYLVKFPGKEIVIVCKREAGWHAVKKFSEITGIRAYTKKYPAGILTNTTLDNFIEVDLVFICDPWLDKNALEDAKRMRVPVLSICDTNNFTKGINKIIPGNNKSAKSLGMILYLLAKHFVEKNNIQAPEFKIQDFIEGWDEAQIPS